MSLAWSSVKALSIPVSGTARDVKRVTAGGVTLWEKPNPLPYDAEVEYLESTGTQYIDTGVVGNNNCKVSARGQVSPGACFARLAEYINPTMRYASIFMLCANSTPIIYGAYNTSGPGNLVVTSSFGDWVDATIENRKLTVNGTSVFTGAFQMPALHATVQLFGAVIYGEGTQLLTSAKLATVKIWKDGVLVRDLIPVRVGSGANAVGCLYDKLGTGGQNPDGSARNDGLYFRQGSGAFVVGPDKNA